MPYNSFYGNYAPSYFPQQTYTPQYPYQQQAPQQGQATQMTPPTIHAEIIQVDGEKEARDYPVAAGSTQMMMSKDDEHIYIKTAYAAAPAQLIVYNKAEPVEEKEVDLGQFVTREEFEKRLEEFFNT